MINEVLGLIFTISIITFVPWNLIALAPDRKLKKGYHPDLSIVIPAHDEASVIGETIESVYDSGYPGKIDVVVVNDGSKDDTGNIVKKLAKKHKDLRLVETDHVGKAMAVNRGVAESSGEVILFLDADSQLDKDALKRMAEPFEDGGVGAVSGIISVVSNRNPLVWYQDFEYALSSMWRYVFDKIGTNYMLPGFCAVRRRALEAVGGFSIDTLSEDFDIGLGIRKKGYRIVMSKAVMYTNVPQTLFGIAKQRIRWGRGTIQVIRKHNDMLLNPKHGLVGLYGMPNQIYFFIQGFMIIPLTLYQILRGYFEYFISKGVYLNIYVVKYFIGWSSQLGTLEFIYNVYTGIWEMPPTFPIFITSWILTTFYHVFAAVKMRRINCFLTQSFNSLSRS